MPIKHTLLAFTVAFIWGSNFVAIRMGLDHMHASLFVFLRFFGVAIPLIFLLPKPAQTQWVVAVYGLLIGVGQFAVLFWAMEDAISPGMASLVVQLQVVFTIMISAVAFNERPHIQQIAALGICLLGLAIILLQQDAAATTLGVMLVLGAGFSWALGNILIKKYPTKTPIGFIAWSSFYASIPLFLFAWLQDKQIFHTVANLSAEAWLIVLWQVIGNTLFGYGAWNILLNRYPAAVITPWALLVPVAGMATSWLVLNESMPLWKWLAAGLILSGLTLNFWSSKRANAKQ